MMFLKILTFVIITLSPGLSYGKIPIIIDTDMAIDDWLAMIYLAHHPESELLALSVTGAGEAHCVPGAQHAVDLMDQTPARGLPVVCGSEEPMDGYMEYPQAWRSSADSFYGVKIPASSRRPLATKASEFIIARLRQSSRPIRIVILGNATNIAQALHKAPDIRSKIERIVFMGGSIWQGGNIIVPGFTDHYKNKLAEWNVMIDPIAARILLRSGIPVTLVPLDGTQYQKVSRDDVAHFIKAAKTEGAKFFSQVLQKTLWFIDSGEYYFWDALTAAVAMNPKFCSLQSLQVDIVVAYSEKTNGNSLPTFSRQRWDGLARKNFDPYLTGLTFLSDEGTTIDVCIKSDPREFKADLIKIVNF